MDEPILVKAFDGLIGETSESAGPAYSTERLSAARQVRESLEGSKAAEEAGLHAIIKDNFPDVSSQYQSAENIQSQLLDTQKSLGDLEKSTRHTDTLTKPLLSLLQSRAHHVISQRSASAHLQALEELQQHVKRLQELEVLIRAGQGDLEGREEGVWAGEGLVIRSEVLRHARAAGRLQERATYLRSLYISQLEDGYQRALHFDQALSNQNGRCVFSSQIRLKAQSADGKKLPSEAPLTTLSFLFNVLDDYSRLTPLLESTREHFIAEIVRPLVRHRSNTKEQARLVSSPAGDSISLTVEVKATELKDSGKDDELYQDLEEIFDHLDRVFVTTESTPQQLAEDLRRFRWGVAEATVQCLLHDRIQAGAPSNRFVLQGWAKRIAKAAEFEARLDTRVQGESLSSISEFYSRDAGQYWAARQQAALLEQARAIIAGGWEGWESVEVKKEQRIGALPLETPRVLDEHTEQELGSTEQNRNSEGEAGWGFDDWTAEEENPKPTPDAPIEITEPVEAESGWGFDDEEGSPVRSGPPSPVVLKTKPIRQARKLGKKQKQSQLEQDEEDQMAGSVYSEQSSAAPSEVAETATEGWNDSTSWEEATSTPVAEPAPLPAGPQIVVERYQVSKACDALLEVVLNVLEIAQGLDSTNVPADSFTNISEVVQSAAPEILDLYQDLMPQAHAAQIDHVPALAMQFSNDCSQIADVVESMAQSSTWDPSESVLKLRELSDMAFEKQMSTQRRGILEDVAMAEGFEGSSSDHTFERQKQVMSQIRHKVEMLHRVWLSVLTEGRCLSSIGLLVETAVARVADDIIAISDITADESERLKQICEVLKHVEDIFSGHDTNIVAYVPHWLRFCYVAEIMDASLADITYLFDSGALVDFTPDELIHMILALFSDTPLRRDTIAKIHRSRISSAR